MSKNMCSKVCRTPIDDDRPSSSYFFNLLNDLSFFEDFPDENNLINLIIINKDAEGNRPEVPNYEG